MIPIPEHLKHLPVYRGFPVPYFVPRGHKEGEFLFKFADKQRILNCVRYHKCCICFKPLFRKRYYFVSGPKGLANHVDSHPPMHEECARYSLEVCPHLFFEKAERTTDDSDGGADFQIREKPKEFFLVKADKYDLFLPDGKTPVISYRPVEFTKFIYKDGKLTQE
jgi:hypothetical protein